MATRHLLLSGLVLLIPPACGGSAPDADAPSQPSTDPELAGPSAPDDWEEPATQEPATQAPARAATDETDEESPLGDRTAQDPKPKKRTKETRTMDVIRGVVLKNRQKVRDCYERELAKSPGLRGTLTIHFKLDPRGNVEFAKLNAPRSTLKQPVLAKCAIDTIKSLKFPESSRGFESEVNYPFDFKP